MILICTFGRMSGVTEIERADDDCRVDQRDATPEIHVFCSLIGRFFF